METHPAPAYDGKTFLRPWECGGRSIDTDDAVKITYVEMTYSIFSSFLLFYILHITVFNVNLTICQIVTLLAGITLQYMYALCQM